MNENKETYNLLSITIPSLLEDTVVVTKEEQGYMKVKDLKVGNKVINVIGETVEVLEITPEKPVPFIVDNEMKTLVTYRLKLSGNARPNITNKKL